MKYLMERFFGTEQHTWLLVGSGSQQKISINGTVERAKQYRWKHLTPDYRYTDQPALNNV